MPRLTTSTDETVLVCFSFIYFLSAFIFVHIGASGLSDLPFIAGFFTLALALSLGLINKVIKMATRVNV